MKFKSIIIIILLCYFYSIAANFDVTFIVNSTDKKYSKEIWNIDFSSLELKNNKIIDFTLIRMPLLKTPEGKYFYNIITKQEYSNGTNDSDCENINFDETTGIINAQIGCYGITYQLTIYTEKVVSTLNVYNATGKMINTIDKSETIFSTDTSTAYINVSFDNDILNNLNIHKLMKNKK